MNERTAMLGEEPAAAGEACRGVDDRDRDDRDDREDFDVRDDEREDILTLFFIYI